MRALALCCALLTLSAFAQTGEPRPDRKVQKVDFTGDLIEGGTLVPMGDIYLPPPKAKFGSLIKVRMNFDDKLRESVHEM